ncbi:MAG: cupin domain-containing protein, partial [Halobacteriota archaeon]
AVAEGQRISEHSAPHEALLQVLDGTATVWIDEEEFTVDEGASLVFPSDVPHALAADEPFKMLLTMLR